MDVLDLVNELVIPIADLQAKLANIPAAIEETKKISYDAGYADGVASVPQAPKVDTTPSIDGTYTKEQVDQLIADAIAALPADVTPFSQEDMDAVKAELELAKIELAQVKSDDESDKAMIAAANAKIEKVTAKIEAIKLALTEE